MNGLKKYYKFRAFLLTLLLCGLLSFICVQLLLKTPFVSLLQSSCSKELPIVQHMIKLITYPSRNGQLSQSHLSQVDCLAPQQQETRTQKSHTLEQQVTFGFSPCLSSSRMRFLKLGRRMDVVAAEDGLSVAQLKNSLIGLSPSMSEPSFLEVVGEAISLTYDDVNGYFGVRFHFMIFILRPSQLIDWSAFSQLIYYSSQTMMATTNLYQINGLPITFIPGHQSTVCIHQSTTFTTCNYHAN